MKMFDNWLGKKKEIEDLQNEIYQINSILNSLLEDLGYVADYDMQWEEVRGVKKIVKSKEASK